MVCPSCIIPAGTHLTEAIKKKCINVRAHVVMQLHMYVKWKMSAQKLLSSLFLKYLHYLLVFNYFGEPYLHREF